MKCTWTQQKICVCRVLSVDSPLNGGWEKGCISEMALFSRAVFLGKRGVSETALFPGVDFFCLCKKSTEKLPLSLRKRGRFRNSPFFKGSFLGKKGCFRNGLFFKGRFFCHCRNLRGFWYIAKYFSLGPDFQGRSNGKGSFAVLVQGGNRLF
jgi:hypothetical protein